MDIITSSPFATRIHSSLFPHIFAWNQITTPAGMTCTQSGNSNAKCIFSPDFISNFKTSLGSGISYKKPSGAKVATLPAAKSEGKVGSTSVPVCEDMADVIPSNCTCTDTSVGGTAVCSVNVNNLDTIELEVDMNVCATPLEVVFTLTDGDTGLVFTYAVDAGEQGEVATGILIGVPGVGDAEIYLTYELNGNLDALNMVFGFDLGITTFGYTTYCSSIYPSECPLIFLNETIDFGDSC